MNGIGTHSPGMAWATGNQTAWEARARRAGELAQQYPFAAELLHFYRHVTEFHHGLYQSLASCHYTVTAAGDTLPSAIDLIFLLPSFGNFLRVIDQRGSAELAQSARETEFKGPDVWLQMLESYWSG